MLAIAATLLFQWLTTAFAGSAQKMQCVREISEDDSCHTAGKRLQQLQVSDVIISPFHLSTLHYFIIIRLVFHIKSRKTLTEPLYE